MIKWLFLVYGILFSIPAFWSIFFLREQMLLPFSILAGVNFVVFAIMHAAQQSVRPTWGRLGNNWTGSRAPRG